MYRILKLQTWKW